MCAVSDPNAKLALQQLPKLAGCQLHTSAILSAVDMNTFKKLGIEFTNEAVYEVGCKRIIFSHFYEKTAERYKII